MSKRLTMADVAREAGVSVMTVSRVINNAETVSETTRQRVLQVVAEMGYRPSGIARGLATQRTGTLGLVVPDIANPFFSGVARGAEQVAYAEGYNVFLCNSEEDPARELDILRSLEEKRVDGVMLCSSRLAEDELMQALAGPTKSVLVNRRLHADGHLSVMVDDAAGAEILTQHLIAGGRTRIGVLAGPPTSHSSALRVEGYRRALTEAGLFCDPAWVTPCAPDAVGGLAAGRDLLRRYPTLDALICYNDLVAVGALQACAELGRAVPDVVSVTGFDDIPLAGLVTPPLTTCRIPLQEMGAEAMRLLLAQINGSSIAQGHVWFRPDLVVRASAPL